MLGRWGKIVQAQQLCGCFDFYWLIFIDFYLFIDFLSRLFFFDKIIFKYFKFSEYIFEELYLNIFCEIIPQLYL